MICLAQAKGVSYQISIIGYIHGLCMNQFTKFGHLMNEISNFVYHFLFLSSYPRGLSEYGSIGSTMRSTAVDGAADSSIGANEIFYRKEDWEKKLSVAVAETNKTSFVFA